ncbi:MAG: hypothetical protein ACYC6N_00800 [Pirellulaceae bacterium]
MLSELRDFAETLPKVARLHLVPDVNDDVGLNIAPLWKQWEQLMDGKYKWSSISRQLRPKGMAL